jgi:hypothetical protein
VSGTLRTAVLRLAARVLEPLIRLLLDVGVGAGEMTRLVRSVYVRVASERVSRGQDRPNISRIAIVTGLARPEIRAILAAPPDNPAQYSWDRHRAERVLHAWCNDPTYFDAEGKPADLPRKGGKKSFAALVKLHSGSRLTATILEELERAQAVKVLADGKLRLLSRTLANAQFKEATVETVGERARDLLTTLAHNLSNPEHPRFERTVASVTLDPREVPRVRRDIEAQGETFVSAATDLLHWPRVNVTAGDEAKAASRMGVTVFIFEEPVVVPPRKVRAAQSGGRKGNGSKRGTGRT